MDYVAKGSDYADFEERYNSWSLLVLVSPWSVFYSALNDCIAGIQVAPRGSFSAPNCPDRIPYAPSHFLFSVAAVSRLVVNISLQTDICSIVMLKHHVTEVRRVGPLISYYCCIWKIYFHAQIFMF